MKTRRMTAGFLAAALAFGIVPAVAASDYVNVAELYAQTRGGWRQTYEAKHNTVTIDMDIDVPDVRTFPIINMQVNTNLLIDDTASTRGSMVNHENGSLWINALDNDSLLDGVCLSVDYYPEAKDGQAENSPMTAEDAEAMFMALCSRYFIDVDNIHILFTVAFRRAPKSKFEARTELTLAHGWYFVRAEQRFGGIPLLIDCQTTDRWMPFSRISATLYDEEHYRLDGRTINQVGVEYEDIPLLSWDAIRKVIEEEYIKTGRFTYLYSVRLGYQPVLFDPGENNSAGWFGDRKSYPEGTFSRVCQVRPVWVVEGYAPAYDYNKLENPADNPWWKIGMTEYKIAIDAQTGKIVADNDGWHYVNTVGATVLQWSDIE